MYHFNDWMSFSLLFLFFFLNNAITIPPQKKVNVVGKIRKLCCGTFSIVVKRSANNSWQWNYSANDITFIATSKPPFSTSSHIHTQLLKNDGNICCCVTLYRCFIWWYLMACCESITRIFLISYSNQEWKRTSIKCLSVL